VAEALQRFYANGKVLLSGEYAVLDGALALALPCRYGQWLELYNHSAQVLHWESYDEQGSCWFSARFGARSLRLIECSDLDTGSRLEDILQEAALLNPDLPLLLRGARLVSRRNFPADWGLGSSSTLLYTVAKLAQVDAFTLSERTFGGSGYDVACAAARGPILYQRSAAQNRPGYVETTFYPDFRQHLYFVYLRKKQNSREGIRRYRSISSDRSTFVQALGAATERLLRATDLQHFQEDLLAHELLVAEYLGMPRVQQQLFDDFPGTIKSLGAWGGDFVLAASAEAPAWIEGYFRKKEYTTILPYDRMVLPPVQSPTEGFR